VKRPTHEDGFVEHMPYEEYAEIDALNFSTLKPMMRSPLAYKWALDNPHEETAAMMLGTATHRMILEPNRIGEFAVWGDTEEEKVRRGKVWDAFLAVQDGKTVITANERDAMVGISTMVRKNPLAAKYLRDEGPTEVSMFWHDRTTGRAFKGRIDKLIPEKHIMVNLKTCRSSQPRRFGAQAFQLGYYAHEALYWDGYKQLTGESAKQKIIAFESKEPWEGAVYRITPDVRLLGLEKIQELLTRLQWCEENNSWPPEMEEESDLILPSYAMESDPESLEEFSTETEEA
jgi:hypothetical protein